MSTAYDAAIAECLEKMEVGFWRDIEMNAEMRRSGTGILSLRTGP